MNSSPFDAIIYWLRSFAVLFCYCFFGMVFVIFLFVGIWVITTSHPGLSNEYLLSKFFNFYVQGYLVKHAILSAFIGVLGGTINLSMRK